MIVQLGSDSAELIIKVIAEIVLIILIIQSNKISAYMLYLYAHVFVKACMHGQGKSLRCVLIQRALYRCNVQHEKSPKFNGGSRRQARRRTRLVAQMVCN